MADHDKERELWFTDEFLPKVVERLTLVLDCIRNKKEILESDFEIVEEVQKWWFEGKFGWNKSNMTEKQEEVTQIGLFVGSDTETPSSFDDSRDKILDGTVIDIPAI